MSNGDVKVIPELTPDEKQLLKECNLESLYRRSIPLIFLGCSTFHYLYKRNMVKQGAYSIKQFVIAACSLVAGRVSYLNTCREKILNSNLPEDSTLKKVFNAGRSNTTDGTNETIINESQKPKLPDLNTNQPLTYDELRKQNRESYSKPNKPLSQSFKEVEMSKPQSQNDVFNMNENDSQQVFPKTPKVYTQQEKPKKLKTNQYGDIISDD